MSFPRPVPCQNSEISYKLCDNDLGAGRFYIYHPRPKVLGRGEVGGNGNVTHGLKASYGLPFNLEFDFIFI